VRLGKPGFNGGSVMTPSELKYQYETKQSGHFFERKTMKFFGDTMKNYGCRNAGSHWELYRKRSVKHGVSSSHYFDKVTFDETTTLPV